MSRAGIEKVPAVLENPLTVTNRRIQSSLPPPPIGPYGPTAGVGANGTHQIASGFTLESNLPRTRMATKAESLTVQFVLVSASDPSPSGTTGTVKLHSPGEPSSEPFTSRRADPTDDVPISGWVIARSSGWQLASNHIENRLVIENHLERRVGCFRF